MHKMSKTLDRMYQLCLPRLQKYEYGHTTVGNSHHVAQLMAYYALIASLSDQKWWIMEALLEKRYLSSKSLAEKLNIKHKVVSAQLSQLADINLVTRPTERGGFWVINPFIEAS